MNDGLNRIDANEDKFLVRLEREDVALVLEEHCACGGYVASHLRVRHRCHIVVVCGPVPLLHVVEEAKLVHLAEYARDGGVNRSLSDRALEYGCLERGTHEVLPWHLPCSTASAYVDESEPAAEARGREHLLVQSLVDRSGVGSTPV